MFEGREDGLLTRGPAGRNQARRDVSVGLEGFGLFFDGVRTDFEGLAGEMVGVAVAFGMVKDFVYVKIGFGGEDVRGVVAAVEAEVECEVEVEVEVVYVD